MQMLPRRYNKLKPIKKIVIWVFIIISIQLTGCSLEKIGNKVPKVFLNGDIQVIESFYRDYADSLSKESKFFLQYLLGQRSSSEMLTLKNSNDQLLLILKWGVLNKEWDIKFKCSVIYILNYPFLAVPKSNSAIESGLYSQEDSLRLLALHIASHYPPKYNFLIRQKMENQLNKSTSIIPKEIFIWLNAKNFYLENMENRVNEHFPYPGLNIDSLFIDPSTTLATVLSWPDLYSWDWLTARDSSEIDALPLDDYFFTRGSNEKYVIWKCYAYFNISPLSKLLTGFNLDSLYRNSHSRFKNAILSTLLSDVNIDNEFPLISTWLTDTTLSDNEHKRIVGAFPEEPPSEYFESFYELLDNPYLQKKVLKLIVAMDNSRIDSFLISKMRENNVKEMQKAIYVSGFRKSQESLPLLESFLSHSDEVIRFNAKEAIQRIKSGKIY